MECPMKREGRGSDSHRNYRETRFGDCDKDVCAWWSEKKKMCSIKALGEFKQLIQIGELE